MLPARVPPSRGGKGRFRLAAPDLSSRRQIAMALLEIRPVRTRDRGVLSRVPLGVFGADKLQPFVQGAPKRYGRRPRRRESACILDRDLDLQPLALVVEIGPQSIVGIRLLEMLFCVLFYGR